MASRITYQPKELRSFLLPQELDVLEQIDKGNLTSKKKLFGRMSELGYVEGTYKQPKLTSLGKEILESDIETL